MRRLIALILIVFPLSVFSRNDSTLMKNTELKIMKYLEALSVVKNDRAQNDLNDSIIYSFPLILNNYLSFNYPFDSLKTMGKLNTDDDEIRFYTWNIPYEDGSQKIQGILQYKVNKDSVTYLILEDHSQEIENPEMITLNPHKWYGALYYDVVTKKIDKHKYYFVMGYNPGNLFSNYKILDVFYFDEYGYPFFGKPFFKEENKKKYRVVLEYNEKAAVTLHYNEKLKMILFHHLVPIDYKYKNNPQFYGPDFTFDGFEFKDDMWNFIENVDVRNNY